MVWTKSWGGAAALCLLAGTALAQPRWPAVDAAVQPLVDRGQLSGAVTLVIKDGKTVHASAIGKQDLASGAPMRMDTLFRAFSMSKPVTAVAMMILYDEGRWKPDDPVAKFLPELAGVKVLKGLDADGKPILEPVDHAPTMRELMTHSAGFGYGFSPSYVDQQYRAMKLLESPSADVFVANLAKAPLDYQPGTHWEYSVSVDVQGAIIERLSGQKLADFMQSRIFGPLKMVDTGFYVPASKMNRFATLYALQDDKLTPAPGQPYDAPPGFASGGAGLVTTAGDYARFAQMLLNGGSLDGVRVISAASAKTIMSNHLTPALLDGKSGIGPRKFKPGYEFGYDGAVVTDPAVAGLDVGKGTYFWDGAAGTWFWADPQNHLVFVGMIQRMMFQGQPTPQSLTQAAVKATLAQ